MFVELKVQGFAGGQSQVYDYAQRWKSELLILISKD
jgi:hypothetical protein